MASALKPSGSPRRLCRDDRIGTVPSALVDGSYAAPPSVKQPPRPARRGASLWCGPAASSRMTRHGGGRLLWFERRLQPRACLATNSSASVIDADDRFHDSHRLGWTLEINGKQASVIWGRERWQPPGVAHVFFLRKRSSACRCPLDPGRSRYRPEGSVPAGAAGRSLSTASGVRPGRVGGDRNATKAVLGARPPRRSQCARRGGVPVGGCDGQDETPPEQRDTAAFTNDRPRWQRRLRPGALLLDASRPRKRKPRTRGRLGDKGEAARPAMRVPRSFRSGHVVGARSH
jgi:hypothetical protein